MRPVAHGLGQRLLVDDAAAGHVDDPQLGLGLGQQVGADQARPSRASSGRWMVTKSASADEAVERAAARPTSGGPARPTRTGRRRRAACRRPAPAAPPACRCGRGPTMPSVLSASSTPSHRDALPAARPSRAAWAWGTLRAWASSSAMVCSAAEMMFDCGALTTMTPRRVAASTSTLSRPMPARPTTTRSAPAASTSAVTWVAERMMRASAPLTASSSSLGGQAEADVDLVAGGAQAGPGRARRSLR